MQNMKTEDEMLKHLALLHDDDTTLLNLAPERLLEFSYLHDLITSYYTTRSTRLKITFIMRFSHRI